MARRQPLQFQLLIKPAGSRCNLRCSYCFYYDNDRHFPTPEQGRGEVMSIATMEAMVRELLSYRMPQTVFAWQGGEPTLAGL
ncbi:radical SAM protein, partial [bacterium]|nr:radical SAM protein [bacterium]